MSDNILTSFSLRRRRTRRQRLFRLLLVIFVFLTALYFIFNLFAPLNIRSIPLFGNNNSEPSRSLKQVVEESLKEAKGTYAVSVKNLKTGESYYRDEHKVFEAGSLYKLWVMGAVYKQIQSGAFAEGQLLSEDVVSLNEKFNISSDSAELTEGTISSTVEGAIKQMISISHNYSALLLAEKIKLSSVATFLKDSGLSESQVGTDGDAPKTTVSDIVLFYEKLYKGELANQEYTQKMLDVLKNQNLNDGLPKYLPKKPQVDSGQRSYVAHKTGDIGWFKHDGGIVFNDKADYIIVIMSESEFPPGAQERIALISKVVYDYFNKGI